MCVRYLYIIENIEVADEFITSKNTDLTRFLYFNLDTQVD